MKSGGELAKITLRLLPVLFLLCICAGFALPGSASGGRFGTPSGGVAHAALDAHFDASRHAVADASADAGRTAPPHAGPGARSDDPVARGRYIESLIESAERLQLDQDRYWHVLLHYKRGLFGLRSLVDDPKFFADPNGKHDPKAELHATIRAFFAPPLESAPEDHSRSGSDSSPGDTTDSALDDSAPMAAKADAAAQDSLVAEKHPMCRFVARYDWLDQKLNIDESLLAVPRCEPFETLMEQIQPESATLIFPTSHMNSPASMYGHTLLTIETATKSKLLAYAVNYSAMPSGSTFAPIYMAKGLFGGYPGYFSILPYYAKLQEYSDVNDRDIWEYTLNLDRAEIRRLVMHTYEMENVYANYFFFSENCSYDLLFLLEAARPTLDLTDQFGWWVIPLDTIREIKAAGVVDEAIYRPSKSTKVDYLAASLEGDQRKLAWEVAKGQRPAIEILQQVESKEEQIRTTDLASEYLQYIYTKGDLEKDAYLPRFLRTLEVRSGLGESSEWRYSIPAPGRPDEGHQSNRVALSAGAIEEEPFQEIRLRPAYHELLDNGTGFKMGSQIVFSDVAVRYYSRRDKLQLEAINLIDIVSIAPRTRFFKHISWKVNTGFFRRTLESRDYLLYGLNLGLGPAYDIRALGLSYLFLEGDIHVGGALDHGYSSGGGASAGILRDLTAWWKLHLMARYLEYPLGDETDHLQLGIQQSIELSPNVSIAAGVRRSTERDESTVETKVGVNVFF